ncbi:MerR family transcriptional regulator [Xylanimonas oleitrophica]|uniref:MerR family transcriptional regulator n=1 Tax=Xylanimonas oleitrophica TaxID=2607479 RepID=A0A2W5WPS6_9MICO|nr:MerR family transcriptional regulator [Xylanimonas oleitrophica]PZR52942.1 MerR family transcriptional regulator [Xylanimonas oleitrophica]
MDWSIQEIARLAGVSSRTLRHYDAVGLLHPSRVAAGGVRRYDRAAVARLQRILLLRELGLGLEAVGRVLAEQTDEARALRDHLDALRTERARLDRQVASVERTLAALEGGERLMAADMLDGFDHTQHREEVERRWGRDAYARSDAWWRGLGDEDRERWKQDAQQLGEDWAAAARAGVDPASDEAQALAARHARWLATVPGTPGHEQGRAPDEYLLGLGEMYVADERFAAAYGGTDGARLVRDALRVHVERRA